jgi:hypothetical protein
MTERGKKKSEAFENKWYCAKDNRTIRASAAPEISTHRLSSGLPDQGWDQMTSSGRWTWIMDEVLRRIAHGAGPKARPLDPPGAAQPKVLHHFIAE